jgi:hypothetical protein
MVPMNVRGLTWVAVSLLLVASACGGEGTKTGASGLAGSKPLVSLTDAEKGQLCDWMVPKAGSYGNPGSCDLTQPTATFPFLTYPDQAACIEDAVDAGDPDCLATVAELEACVNLLPPCATLTDAANTPACGVISGC